MIDITTLGAKPSASDNSAALAEALHQGAVQRRPVHIPGAPEPYRFSQPLVQTRCGPIFGDGMVNSILEFTGTGTALTIQPKAINFDREECRGSVLRDFWIRPKVKGQGVSGIDVKLSPAYADKPPSMFANFDWKRVRCGTFGGHSARLLNDIPNTDGIFLGKIALCYFENGLKGTFIGDTVTFEQNAITGAMPLDVSGHPLARRQTWDRNSITTTGGAMFCGVSGLRFWNNWIEIGDFDGVLALLDIYGTSVQTEIRYNTITSLINPALAQPLYGILVRDSAQEVSIDHIEMAGGTAAHIYAPPSTRQVRVGTNNKYLDGAPRVVIQSAP